MITDNNADAMNLDILNDPLLHKKLHVKDVNGEQTVTELNEDESIPENSIIEEKHPNVVDIDIKSDEIETSPVSVIEEEVDDIDDIESQIEVAPKIEKRANSIEEFDIKKISIVSPKNDLDKAKLLNNVLHPAIGSQEITLPQSGYYVKVSPLVHQDGLNIMHTDVDRYEYKKTLYKTIYDKITETAVGNLTFDQWLKVTSLEDLETFYYGLYCATFPNNGKFSFECQECGQEHEYEIRKSNLITTSNTAATKELTDNIRKEVKDAETMSKYSMLTSSKTFKLPVSKIIIELKTPSLYDSLLVLKTIPVATIDKNPELATELLYIDKFYIPGNKENEYIAESDKSNYLNIINNLPIDDAAAIQDTIYDISDRNRITYSIKGLKCPDCGKEYDNVPVSLEELLFTQIFERIQQY